VTTGNSAVEVAREPERDLVNRPSRKARLTSVSERTMVKPGRGATGARLGTATVRHPAAIAEAIPVGESSMATHCHGSTHRVLAATW
jgi:hypothetical protein